MTRREEYINDVMKDQGEAERLIDRHAETLAENEQLRAENNLLKNKLADLLPFAGLFQADAYILIDFERTYSARRPFYWCPGRRGYTDDINDAGRYPAKEARALVLGDIDGRTFAISEQDLKTVLVN